MDWKVACVYFERCIWFPSGPVARVRNALTGDSNVVECECECEWLRLLAMWYRVRTFSCFAALGCGDHGLALALPFFRYIFLLSFTDWDVHMPSLVRCWIRIKVSMFIPFSLAVPCEISEFRYAYIQQAGACSILVNEYIVYSCPADDVTLSHQSHVPSSSTWLCSSDMASS